MRGATNKKHTHEIRSLGTRKKSIMSDEDEVDAVPTMHCSRQISDSQGTRFPTQVVDQSSLSARKDSDANSPTRFKAENDIATYLLQSVVDRTNVHTQEIWCRQTYKKYTTGCPVPQQTWDETKRRLSNLKGYAEDYPR